MPLTLLLVFSHSGMIDSPGGTQETMDRGYDFPGVVRKYMRATINFETSATILTDSLLLSCVERLVRAEG